MVVCNSRFFTSDLDLVHVAPAPVFAGLERFDDGVLCLVEMFGGVAVGGTVETSDVAAGKTKPKMAPLPADLQAVFTAFGRRGDFLDLFYVFASHDGSLDTSG